MPRMYTSSWALSASGRGHWSRMLSAGHTDEAASRQLGVSLRTYRRRVAELMAMLDATSRFQAGIRAREFDDGE